MQGYILRITHAKNEDLIVNILTQTHHYTLYRFFGARHSVINLGYKIDFEIEYQQRGFLPLLRKVIHIHYPWLSSTQRNLFWQQFIEKFYYHLKELETVDSFYYDIIEESAKTWEKQNPKRVAIEKYVTLLQKEGRLHSLDTCFLCEGKINGELTLVRGFLPAHIECIPAKNLKKKSIKYLFSSASTLFLEDEEIDFLWKILMEGF